MSAYNGTNGRESAGYGLDPFGAKPMLVLGWIDAVIDSVGQTPPTDGFAASLRRRPTRVFRSAVPDDTTCAASVGELVRLARTGHQQQAAAEPIDLASDGSPLVAWTACRASVVYLWWTRFIRETADAAERVVLRFGAEATRAGLPRCQEFALAVLAGGHYCMRRCPRAPGSDASCRSRRSTAGPVDRVRERAAGHPLRGLPAPAGTEGPLVPRDRELRPGHAQC